MEKRNFATKHYHDQEIWSVTTANIAWEGALSIIHSLYYTELCHNVDIERFWRHKGNMSHDFIELIVHKVLSTYSNANIDAIQVHTYQWSHEIIKLRFRELDLKRRKD